MKDGVAEIAFISLATHGKLFPANNVVPLPALNFPSTKEGLVAGWEVHMKLRAKFKVLQDEMADVKLLQWALEPGIPITRIYDKLTFVTGSE